MKHSLIACLLPFAALLPGAACAQEASSGTAAAASEQAPVALVQQAPEQAEPAVAEETPAVATVESGAATEQAAEPAEAAEPAVPVKPAVRMAFIMPPEKSGLTQAAEMALKGVLATNYASSDPYEVLIVRPGENETIREQLEQAALAGAVAAIGPIDRESIDEIANMEYLPLPVVTLNQIELDREIPMTQEEIDAKILQENAGQQSRVEEVEQLEDAIEDINKHFEEQEKIAAEAEKADALAAIMAMTATESENADGDVAATPAEAVPVPLENAAAREDAASDDYKTELVSDPKALAAAENTSGAEEGPADNVSATIAEHTSLPGLVLAQDIPPRYVKYEPRQFPRGLLMLGLSIEDDARYVASMGVRAMPELSESGKRPKVLLLDHDTPMEKRISQAMERELVALGYAPDKLTVNTKDLRTVTKFFDFVIEIKNTAEEQEAEELIDPVKDPLGWRQQQMRLRKIEARNKAVAALAEPPYHAVFLAMDANNASLIRSRLPIRSRIWATAAAYPGNPRESSAARALTYDLKEVTFVDSTMMINFDSGKFEEQFKVPVPPSNLAKRLFALGGDAHTIAARISSGSNSGSISGLLGNLTYDLDYSPKIERRGTAAMIYGGSIRPMTAEKAIAYEVRQIDNKSLDSLQRTANAEIPDAPQQEAANDNEAATAEETQSSEPAAQATAIPLE